MKTHIDIKRFIIRLLILAVVCVGTIIAVYLSTPANTYPHYRGNAALGAFILLGLESIVVTIWLAIEAVILQIRKKTEKRNANLSLLLLIFFAWIIFCNINF